MNRHNLLRLPVTQLIAGETRHKPLWQLDAKKVQYAR
ncbi:hypothetical protein BHAOGJBA_6295 [Methylobacterium hispanicum]|uniref:Uncharacterized protein n=1 Tax=Methylobacterium hispanicum TaxID=270350 RepID=A0AAV4ZX86_9HYPH|nr:hypothetical protein BHAOGJBA_6295 [Methylobacterium hispanicum]